MRAHVYGTKRSLIGSMEPAHRRDLYFILFQACHGTRTGETGALQHQDIDLKNDTVTIQRAFSRTFLRPFAKTKRVRVISLDPVWRELYVAHPRNINPEAFVFTRKGKPFSESWARKKWKEARGKTSLGCHTVRRNPPQHSLTSGQQRGQPLSDRSFFGPYEPETNCSLFPY